MLAYSIQILVNICFGTLVSYLSFFNLLEKTSWKTFDFIVFFFGIVFTIINVINYQNTINYYLQIKKNNKNNIQKSKNDKNDFQPPDDSVTP